MKSETGAGGDPQLYHNGYQVTTGCGYLEFLSATQVLRILASSEESFLFEGRTVS